MEKRVFAALILLFVFLFPFVAFGEEGRAWETLEPISKFAEEFDVPIKWGIFLISISILAISLLAYSKSRSKRVLIISFAFLLFCLKAFFKVLDLYISPGDFFSKAADDAADLMIMLSIFIAVFYRKSHEKFFEKDLK